MQSDRICRGFSQEGCDPGTLVGKTVQTVSQQKGNHLLPDILHLTLCFGNGTGSNYTTICPSPIKSPVSGEKDASFGIWKVDQSQLRRRQACVMRSMKRPLGQINELHSPTTLLIASNHFAAIPPPPARGLYRDPSISSRTAPSQGDPARW